MSSRQKQVADGTGERRRGRERLLFACALAILVLSPLGVAPAWQNRGIGMALTRAALAAADGRSEPLMIVQGHPNYYPRFGFVRGRTVGILPPEHLGEIDRAWMARPGPTWVPSIRGRVEYPSYFAELD